MLTPHPGEFQRLLGEACSASESERISQAARLARKDTHGQTIVVLKGHRSIVCDGTRYAINQNGNPGMATGGSGDCLTGVIAALAGWGATGEAFDLWDAARLGVALHGRAGDLAAEALGEDSMIASDLIRYLPDALQEHREK